MIDFNKIKADTEEKQKKFGKYSLADISCFALIEAIDSMFSANARAEAAETRAAELEAHLAGSAATVTQLTKERDEQRQRADILDRACANALNERDEARQERDNLRMSIVNNVSA